MSRRTWIIVGIAAVVVAAALFAAYATGVIIIGDPFSGVWNAEGTWTSEDLNAASLIKQTDDGYVYTSLVGEKALASHPLQRDGRTLSGEWDGDRYTFEYQPLSGHLVWRYWDHGVLRVSGMSLTKVTDSTSLPSGVD